MRIRSWTAAEDRASLAVQAVLPRRRVGFPNLEDLEPIAQTCGYLDPDPPEIGTMVPGDRGWTVAWALRVDGRRRCWLDPSFPFWGLRGGTTNMRIECRDAGMHVRLPGGEKWGQSSRPPRPWWDVGMEMVPVATLSRMEWSEDLGWHEVADLAR